MTKIRACRLSVLLACAALPALASDACDLEAPDARAAGANCARAWMDANLRLHDLQVIGTHNSYKLPTWPRLPTAHREHAGSAPRRLARCNPHRAAERCGGLPVEE